MFFLVIGLVWQDHFHCKSPSTGNVSIFNVCPSNTKPFEFPSVEQKTPGIQTTPGTVDGRNPAPPGMKETL